MLFIFLINSKIFSAFAVYMWLTSTYAVLFTHYTFSINSTFTAQCTCNTKYTACAGCGIESFTFDVNFCMNW